MAADKIIQITQSSMPDFDEYMEEIRELWVSHWLTNMGVKHKELTSLLKRYLGVDNLTLFTNGHLALESVISVLGLTGEVITTPFTFASTTHAIVRNGLVPIFCDINDFDYTIDERKIERLITEKTSAIIPVHVHGNVCNVAAIEKIAKKYDLKVVYDAAHAFGVYINDIGIGNYGDASMFSFHATKVFNTIEGGAITFKDNMLENRLNEIKNFGITNDKEIINCVGGNFKMNEFQAAMGICNLRHVHREIDKREKIVDRYRCNLKHVKGIKLVEEQKGVRSNYSYFSILFDGFRKSRDDVYEVLKSHKIGARKYFYPLTFKFNCYKNMFCNVNVPIAEYVADNILTLPLYADLEIEDVDRICDIILMR